MLLIQACVMLALLHPPASVEDAAKTCSAIVEVGEAQAIDPWIWAAMAWRESTFNPLVVGSRGELGAVQVMPGYVVSPRGPFTRDMLTDHLGGVLASAFVIQKWRAAGKTEEEWPRCYASGNNCSVPRWFERRTKGIEKTLRELSRVIEAQPWLNFQLLGLVLQALDSGA